MAKGKYEKPGSGKVALVLLLIVTMLVIGGCAVGVFMVLNGKEPAAQPGDQSTAASTPAETRGETETTTAATTQPPEVTTAPVEETVAQTTEATVEATTEETTLTTVPEETGIGDAVAQTALAQVGKPYKSGGNGPDGFDTSGLLFYCLQQNGLISKRLKMKQLALEGTEVAREALQPGDVVFFWSSNEGEVEYGGIYVGGGKFVAARNEQNPVSEMDFESNYFQTRYLTARRFGSV